MKPLSIDPRPPINQGIDVNNPLVKEHTEIYNRLLAQVEEQHNTAIGFITMNPFGTAPLSGYCGLWSNVPSRVYVRITDDIGSVTVGYYQDLKIGANMIPLAGFSPGSTNELTVIPNIRETDERKIDEGKIDEVGNSERSIVKTIVTDPLPPTDAELPPTTDSLTGGFPVLEVTVPMKNPPMGSINELYFVAFSSAFLKRYCVGIDYTGTVRWYTTLDIPSFNMLRLRDGTFLSTGPHFDSFTRLYHYDIVGRIHTVYILDNWSHHSLFEMPNGEILMCSETTGETSSDGLSIIRLSDGLETAYYDTRQVLDTERSLRPWQWYAPDWNHINQSYYNESNDLLVTSGRHQSTAWGMKASDGQLVFILANHDGWHDDFLPYLLTPVDENGNALYDFNNPDDFDRADKEFWNWGQHACLEIPNSAPGMVEFLLFDNGNFRSREDEKSILPNDNWSRIVHYLVDTNNMTVQKIYEYGREEVGSRGYSSYVCNQQILDNGNYMINFGGHIIDENGRVTTVGPGVADLVDPLVGDQAMGMVILQEINPKTSETIFELTCSSGKHKNETDNGSFREEFYSFRALKLSIV